MAVLLLFCLPLVLGSYIFQLEEKEKHFLAFFLGSVLTSLCLFSISYIVPKTFFVPNTLQNFIWNVFFIQTGIPLCIAVLATLLLFRFNFLILPSALFGLFTVKIYQQLFLMSTHVRILPIFFHIVVYVGALFIFDALLRLCSGMSFYYITAFCCSFLLFVGILMLGFLGLGLWFFHEQELFYRSIFAGIVLIGIGMHIIVYRKGIIG